MVRQVSDARSNRQDQIWHVVKVLGRSKHRLAVFEAIYHGKKKEKTATEISDKIKLPRIRVLQEAGKLADQQVVGRRSAKGETYYEKDNFYGANKREILRLVRNPSKLKNFPTKVTPSPIGQLTTLEVAVPRQSIQTKEITVDDITSFSEVRRVGDEEEQPRLSEACFKEGIKQILSERGQFKDWGGERNDLITTRVRLTPSKRIGTAFAFKGPGTKGKLTPAKMGKNGDQIQRLFQSPAEVFIVQYCGEIADTVIEQMSAFARIKSVADNTKIFYGVIDGQDTSRLIAAYPQIFQRVTKRKSKRKR